LAIFGVEYSIDVEDLFCVDCVARTLSKVFVGFVKDCIIGALALMVTFFVLARFARRITAMSGCAKGVFVGLH